MKPTPYQIYTFICCWLTGMSSSLFSLIQPQLLPELLFSTDRTLINQYGSYILFSFLSGWMLGGFFIGYFSDQFAFSFTYLIGVVTILFSPQRKGEIFSFKSS